MHFFPDADLRTQKALAAILGRLGGLFLRMEQKYDEAARAYGFHCDGCAENCCETRFYHHTLIEYAFLAQGVETLAQEIRESVLTQAVAVVDKTLAADKAGRKIRIMCPLNRNQRCIAYAYRPMICRLHGIAHELHSPNGGILRGQGCRQFDACAQGKPYFRFDRTPFYREMAILEQEARLITGMTHKIKMTVADMLMAQHRITRKDSPP
ncbi:MAG: hypothetical protein RBT11_02665 [Desulfobacterales bacterium]|jgi:Fe-S-cluster containining protein|nr:hypothetical protein [Desulfobacterales bacterium]